MPVRGFALCSVVVLIGLLVAPASAQQPDDYRAGLVVLHGDGSVVTACVTFAEESISGAELLRRSGLQVTLGAYGGLGYGVCAIDGEGCPEGGQDCFCRCRSSPCAYWVYSHRQPDGSWAISGVGASAWQVRDGDVDGWIWGDGTAAPPTMTFEQICVLERVEATVPSPVAATALPNTSAALPSTRIPGGAAPPRTAVTPPSYLGYGVFAVLFLGLAGGLIAVSLRKRAL